MTSDNPYSPPDTSGPVNRDTDTDIGGPFELASPWIRLAAALLDTVILLVPGVVLTYPLMAPYMEYPYEMPFSIELLSTAIYVVLFVLINGWTVYQRGQTVGKLICRVRVVDLQGRQISGHTYLFARYLPWVFIAMIPIAGGVLSLVDAVLIFRRERNCLHDDIARTRVARC